MSTHRITCDELRPTPGYDIPTLGSRELWRGNHFPAVIEMRDALTIQPDGQEMEERAGQEFIAEFLGKYASSLASTLPDGSVKNFFGHVYLARQRAPKFLGWKVLGEITVKNLFAGNDENFQLAPYWRNGKVRT